MHTKMKAIVSALAVGASSLLFGSVRVQATTINFSSAYSGSGVNSIMFSFDGQNYAAQVIGAGTSSQLGAFTFQDLNEFQPDGKQCTVPSGVKNAGEELKLVGDYAAIRVTDGDLIYDYEASATECLDLSSGSPPFPFFTRASGIITGGTGKYTGASGNFTTTFTGEILALPASPGFGAFSAGAGNTKGTITTAP